MELHTLGVDGGYTQEDVIEVARAFTGWTIGRPRRCRASASRRAMHDRGEKTRARTDDSSGRRHRGRRARARHPGASIRRRRGTSPSSWRSASSATRRRRRWSIAPRPRFRETDGDLREVVRAIVTSPEFFAPEALSRQGQDAVRVRRQRAARDRRRRRERQRRSRARSPTWACRCTCASRRPATTTRPTRGSRPGALVNRINFALELSNNRLRGVRRLARMRRSSISARREFQSAMTQASRDGRRVSICATVRRSGRFEGRHGEPDASFSNRAAMALVTLGFAPSFLARTAAAAGHAAQAARSRSFSAARWTA